MAAAVAFLLAGTRKRAIFGDFPRFTHDWFDFLGIEVPLGMEKS
jgi:hypothetical protein